MVEPQTTRFWRAALQSGLLDDAGLGRCLEAIPVEKRTSETIERRLARKAVDLNLLTLWQAQQLMAGRSSGFKIDKYVLIDLVGQGGMGRVYLAKDTRLNRRVALKVLSRERMTNPRALARFRREAKVGAQLQHDNLVRIYDEGEAQGVNYLVMEYIEGRNVGQILAETGPLAPPIAVGIARQIALGLEHARHKELIHRDVNPLNILISTEGIAKLTDLGLAIDLADPEDIVTRDGATVGTFDYISPEQARHSRSVDTRSDIYSLGCSLYHMLTGRVPFPQPSLPEKLYAHQSLDPDPPSTVVPGVPAGLEAVLSNMMKKSVEERYQTPHAVAQALKPFSVTVPVSLVEILEQTRVAVPVGASSDAMAADTIGATSPATGPAVGSDLLGDGSRTGPDLPLLSPSSTSPSVTPAPDPLPAETASNPLRLTPTSQLDSAIPTIDLGPPESLSGSTSVSRVYKAPKVPAGWKVRLNPRIIGAALGGLAALALVVGGVVWFLNHRKATPDRPTINTVRPVEPTPKSAPEPEATAEIVVRTQDGEETPEPSLFEAIRRATGKTGAVILLSDAKVLEFKENAGLVVGSDIIIRARKGARPKIVVVLSGTTPLFRANAQSRLILDGLTFEVAVVEKHGDQVPILIDSAGELTVERCEFVAQGTERDAHVVVAEGLRTAVTGCNFRGFDRPIVFRSHPGSIMQITQSLFVRDLSGSTPNGWAISAEARFARAAKGDHKLVMRHCTAVLGGGLLAVKDFSEAEPLSVTIEDSAIRSLAMLLSPQEAFPKGLKWSGKGNRYAVSDAAWVVLPPGGDGTPVVPSDLKTWADAVGAEAGTTGDPIKLATEGLPPFEEHPTSEFSLADREGDQTPGIDPAKVGPPASK